jgi:SAM-dependent methyltransferase
MSPMPYDKQDRGSDADYAAYFAGMNQSMQQKVALTTAHFPPSGTVCDMGSGSGQATYDLASIYAGLELVGIDINPKAVEISAATYKKPNLRYAAGDIADPLFPPGTLDGILDSSVLHHVTSFNGFSLAAVERLLDNQTTELKPGGVLIIRDFVVPDGPKAVRLDVRSDDGAATGVVAQLSTAALFKRFAATWKGSLGPVTYREEPTESGWARFVLSLRGATEFILRKDYRDHWETELLEEYTYFSQGEFERALEKRGLRIVVSVPLYNPWIIENRYRDRVRIFDEEGRALPFPPTNFLIVGEKTRGGTRLRQKLTRILDAPRFLSLSRYRHKDTGHVYELCERPKRTVDVLPHFEAHGRPFILAKHGFPRPIVSTDLPDLIAQHGAGYITEPIAAIVEDNEVLEAAIARILKERAGLEAKDILRVSPPQRYFTSPGGINERVDACLVDIAPWQHERAVDNYTPFSDAGSVRFFDATQVLRACHIGGMFDARLELNIYRLCAERGYALGPWIGAALTLTDRPAPPPSRPLPPARVAFERQPSAPAAFLEIVEGVFIEEDAAGRTLKEATFEYVRPKRLSHHTMTMLPVMRHGRDIYVGLESRDLPAVQHFEGTSTFLTTPALRLPSTLLTMDDACTYAFSRLHDEHDVEVERHFPLGGRYFPSTGVTPEVVYPFAVDVAAVGERSRLSFFRLADALRLPLIDAHLLIALLRLHHAIARNPTRVL